MKCMNRNTMLIGLLAIAFVFTANNADAQIRYRVAGGLSTDWITSDNPAVYRFASSDTAANPDNEFGGALDGMQVGFGVRMYADLDAQKKFRVPLGVDLYTFSGVQALNASSNTGSYKLRIRHDVDVITGIVGFEYSFIEFPLAYARAFVGGEIRPLYVAPNKILRDEYVIEGGGIAYESHEEFKGKDGAFRVGGLIRLGIEGEIYYPVFLNTSVGYGVMNFIGRDTRSTQDGGRGELLTPFPSNERTEQMISHVNFTFMVQVRL